MIFIKGYVINFEIYHVQFEFKNYPEYWCYTPYVYLIFPSTETKINQCQDAEKQEKDSEKPELKESTTSQEDLSSPRSASQDSEDSAEEPDLPE